MTKTLEERDWTGVHAALDAYYAHDATCQHVVDGTEEMDNVTGSKVLTDWFAKQDELRLACGVAFAEATSDINTMSIASIVRLSFVVTCSKYEVPQS